MWRGNDTKPSQKMKEDPWIGQLGSQHSAGLRRRSTDIHIPIVTWWKHSGLRKLYVMMPILFLGLTINGYYGSLLNGLQRMGPWRDYFGNPKCSDLGLLTAINNIGGIYALLFSSYLAVLLGHLAAVAVGIIIIFVGLVVQSVRSVNRGMFIAGRFLVGLGSNIRQGSAPLLVTELAHPQHRGALTTMYNTLWYIGSIIAAWTIHVGLQAAMPATYSRWLCAKDKPEGAFNILVKYHGDQNDRFCKWQYYEIQNTIRQEKENPGNNWTLLFKTLGSRKRLLLIALVSFFSQCSGKGLVPYYIHSILQSVGIGSSGDQAIINGGLKIWSFLVAIGFSAFLVDVLGRRKLFIIAALGMSVNFSVWTGCSSVYAQREDSRAGSAVIALIFLYYDVAGFAWPGLTVAYCAEILPFNIRAKGLAVNLALTALSSDLQWLFYFVYIAILIIECLCIYFLFVQSKGPTLEEIAALFDGEEASVLDSEELGVKSTSTRG
ncbi:hypothetical protein BDW71DRAFT_196076 [Aspergillus fruticulosus]